MYELKSTAKAQGLFPKQIPVISVDHETTKENNGGLDPSQGSNSHYPIQGYKGYLSYLVESSERAQHGSAYSLVHGAERKMARLTALARHRTQHPNPRRLLTSDLVGVVVCEQKDLVYEEAPASYQDIDHVVECMAQVRVRGNDGECGENESLVRVLATLRPILTYKYKDPYRHR